MKKNNDAPSIRFAGFTDAWEQRKFSELVLIERGGSPRPIDAFITDSPDGLNWIKIGDAPTQGKYITKTEEKIRPEGLSKTRVVQPGDLILSNSMSFGRPYIMGISGCIHDGWLLIRNTKEVFDLTFLCHLLGSGQMLEQYSTLAAGSTVNNLNKELVGSAIVKYPALEEQRKIGAYLERIDDLITLHQRKYDQLVNIKKSMLEKMFPKNGELVPEVRFAGFTDAWEQRKLGTVYQKIRNAFVGTATPFYVKNGHFYLESNNVKNGEINRNSEVFINDDFYEKQRENWLHSGDIVMVQSGHVGHSAVIPDELDNTAAHALIIIANPNVEISPYFVNIQFQSPTAVKRIEHITTGNTIKHILASDMKQFEILVPEHAEQVQISQLFEKLGSLITLHQCKLERLKNIKKACLEKMFV